MKKNAHGTLETTFFTCCALCTHDIRKIVSSSQKQILLEEYTQYSLKEIKIEIEEIIIYHQKTIIKILLQKYFANQK